MTPETKLRIHHAAWAIAAVLVAVSVCGTAWALITQGVIR